MEIIAISGEYPVSNFTRIIPAPNYGKKLVSGMIGDGLIKLVSAGGLRGYRLTSKGKKKLLESNPARFRGFLDGATETNKVRTGYERRLRLHSLAEVCTIMHNVGVEVFQDAKPRIYVLDTTDTHSTPSTNSTPNIPNAPPSTPNTTSISDTPNIISTSVASSQSTRIGSENNKASMVGHPDLHRTITPNQDGSAKVIPAPTNPSQSHATPNPKTPKDPNITRHAPKQTGTSSTSDKPENMNLAKPSKHPNLPIKHQPDCHSKPIQPHPQQPTPVLTSPVITITRPAFYLSREQKGQHDNAIRGSRAAGTLLTPTHVYAIYNTGDTESRWTESIEQRFKVGVQAHVCRELLFEQYKGASVGGIMIGNGMDVLEKYLISTTERMTSEAERTHSEIDPKLNPNSSQRHSSAITLNTTSRPKPNQKPNLNQKPIRHANHLQFFTKTYHPFYFITNDSYGEAQLRILCDDDKANTLKNALLNDYLPKDPQYPVEHDALTKDGNPVLFCCLLNIPQLIQFNNGLRMYGKVGRVIVFDFQVGMMGRYLGADRGRVDFVRLCPDKVMRSLFFE